MKTLRLSAVLLGALTVSAAAMPQDWKAGVARLEGQVLDSETGKPIAGAVVRLELRGRGGTELRSDKKGRWAILGLSGGEWAVEIQAEGYVGTTRSLTVSEYNRIPPVVVSLEKARPVGPPPEVVEATTKAEEAYKAGRYEEARGEYQKLLALRPDLTARLRERIGFTYILQKQFPKALEELKQVLQAEPENAQVRALAVQAALEGGMIEEGRALLAQLDESSIKDPDVFFNMGVNFLNANAPEDAVSYFGKAVALDPAYVDGYYRRALAYLQLGKKDESRVDLKKVVELSPDSEMGQMARKALESLQ